MISGLSVLVAHAFEKPEDVSMLLGRQLEYGTLVVSEEPYNPVASEDYLASDIVCSLEGWR